MPSGIRPRGDELLGGLGVVGDALPILGDLLDAGESRPFSGSAAGGEIDVSIPIVAAELY